MVLVSEPEPILRVSSEIDDVLERRSLDGLKERIRSLEIVAERNREAMPARSAAGRHSITNEDRSIETLTRQVADLRERLGLATWGSKADDAKPE